MRTGIFNTLSLSVLSLALILQGGFAALAANASMTLAAPSTVGVGQNVVVNINVNPGGTAISAIDAVVKYDPGILQFVSHSKGTLFPDSGVYLPVPGSSYTPSLPGTLDLGASMPLGSGSTTTQNGTVLKVTFKALQLGTTTVNLEHEPGSTTDSNVLEPDPTKPDLLTSVQGATIEIVAEQPVVTNPAITSINPNAVNSGQAGVQATISGSGFGTTSGSVDFGGMTASIVAWSDTSITVVVPTKSTVNNFPVTVKVTTAGGKTATVGFTYRGSNQNGSNTNTGLPLIAWPFLIGGNALVAYVVKKKLW